MWEIFHENPDPLKLSESQVARIKAEVKQAAIDHLNTKDADIALSHFTEDVIAVSNDRLFPSFEALAEDVRAYYEILNEVNFAAWDEIHIRVINANAAVFTAKFSYSFSSKDNISTDLLGIWTALYVRDRDRWKIRVRHESFTSKEYKNPESKRSK
jgi:ketosteroid isomerase-like protein